MAERLNSTVRKVDTVARLAGDEFTLILTDINDFRDAATVAKKILRRFSEPFDLDGRPRKVTISIGISLYPTDGQDVPSLLQQADEAMYTAKKQGRDSFRFASADLSQQAFEREALESALRQAVVDGGLEVHYQPIIEVASGRITGAEALLRWRHPEIGLMVPGQFLPLAQHSGLMPAISQWVLKSAFDQGAAWRAAGHGDLRLCINVSASELKDPNFHGLVERLLQETGLPGSSVDFEIPASVGLEGKEPVIRAMEELHRLGCRIALDDFGTGRPDFASFRQLPVNVLKVSPEYIRDVASGGQEAKLVRAATEIAHSLHIEVVAKAVETTDQYDFLRQNQCDRAQGFFFSRPLPPGEFLKLMAGPALSVN